MVAATLTGSRAKTTIPMGGTGPGGDMKVAWGTAEVDASSEDGDIFEVCWVPAGATVIGGLIYSEDGDTGIEALDIDIGWSANGVDAADPNGLGDLGTWTGDASKTAPTGNVFHLSGVLQADGPKTFTVNTKIQLETNTAAATGVAITVTVLVFYLFNA